MEPLLELKNISYSYNTLEGETNALFDINLTVYNGEFISIVGPSGCGKSTLLSIIAGLLSPTVGTININNANIGYMLQHDHLFEWRNIYKNVTLGLEIQHKMDKVHKERIDNMLQVYGLNDFKFCKPSQLSGGMRQRAALIRTLALDPDLLLLDEPFSALDYQTRLTVCDDISSIIKKEGKTAILVTHDLSEAISTGDRVIVLTSRPATIRSDIPIILSIDNRTPFTSRNAPEFKTYFNLIWKELTMDG
ncbi:MAG: ABC transporter ATP-binding protein [Eubacterium sp.]